MRPFIKRKRYPTYKRKRTYKRSRKVARIGTVKRLIAKTEEKHWKGITQLPVNTGYTAPDILLFNGLTKGADRDNRIGNQVRFTSLEIRMSISANSGGGTRGVNRARLLVFWDKQPNGAYPNPGQFFAIFGGAPTTYTIQSPLHPDYFGTRFKLLKDVVMTVGQEGGAVDYAEEKQYKFFIPLKGVRTQYADTNTGNVNEIIKNSLIGFCISDESSSGQPQVAMTSVIKWRDS